MFYPSTRRVFLLKRRIVIAKEGAEKAPVILDVGVDGTRKTVGVDTVAVWLVVLPIARVVDKECI